MFGRFGFRTSETRLLCLAVDDKNHIVRNRHRSAAHNMIIGGLLTCWLDAFYGHVAAEWQSARLIHLITLAISSISVELDHRDITVLWFSGGSKRALPIVDSGML